MFHTTDARRPTLTLSINFGNVQIGKVHTALYDLEQLFGVSPSNLFRHRLPVNRKIENLKTVIEQIKGIKSKGWEKRLPDLNELALGYVVLYNIERVTRKNHPAYGTTAYIYVVKRDLLNSVTQHSTNFVATVDPKKTVPDQRDEAAKRNKVYKFTVDGSVYYVKSKTEADRHSGKIGVQPELVYAYVSPEGRVFPLDSEIKDIRAIDLFSDEVHYHKNQEDAVRKYGAKIFKIKIEGVRSHIFFNQDVNKLKKGFYSAHSDKENKILVVDVAKSFDGDIRKYFLIERDDERLKKVKAADIIEKIK